MAQLTATTARFLRKICAFGAVSWVALAPAIAAADYVGLSGGQSKTPATTGFPGSGSTSAGVNGSYDFNDQWTFGLLFGLTRPHAAPDTAEAFAAKTKDSSSYALALTSAWTPGGAWNADEHWSFDYGLGLSPKSVSLSSTTITFETQTPKGQPITNDTAALLKSASSSFDGALGVNYDTNGDSNFETSFSLGVWPNRVTTTQTIEELQAKNGTTQTRDELLATCQKGQISPALKKTCKHLMPLLKSQEASIVTLPIVFSIGEQFYQNTTVTLGGAYYVYSSDPNAVGYFTLAQQGKQAGGSSS